MASAAGDSDEDGFDLRYSDEEQQSLKEFLATHTLPQPAAVTKGSFMSPKVEIVRGDVLLLRAIAPTQVTLSFVDTDTRAKREVHVNPDIPARFLVLPPKESALSEPDSPQEGGRYRPISMVTYPTVEELLMDCPTFFEANATYDDPYLPGFSIKPGDKFRYVKTVKSTRNGVTTNRLQCRTESGELVCLSPKCRGNFTVLKDEVLYTLRELIDLAKVPRRLKLAPENLELGLPESGEAGQMASAEDASEISKPSLLGIAGLPFTFTGVITMSRPEENVEVSPWDNPETTWMITISANLYVKAYSSSDYEEPVSKKRINPQPLPAFVSEHEHELPAQATLFAYSSPPDTISESLGDCEDIIVHQVVQTPKLFVKDSKKDEYFSISESVDITFVEIPRTLTSIFEMMSLPIGSEVRVLADVAADFPQPFVLRYGDVLRVTKHDSASWKLKHSSTGEVPIVKCERLVPGGKDEKLKLPLDLDVTMVVQTDPSKLRLTKVSDIFSGEEAIPMGNVSVLEGNGGSYAPLPPSLQVLQVLREKELMVSPLDTTVAISPVVKACACIPLRHRALVGFKRKLEFPDGYFRMPTVHQMVPIEKVTEEIYEELEREKKLATEYEDYTFGGDQQTSGSCGANHTGERSHGSRSDTNITRDSITSDESLPTAESKGARKRSRSKDRVRRLSRALNPKNWRKSRAQPEPEELPPPTAGRHPTSGLLTLSLQPGQAKSNEYLFDTSEPSSPTKQHASKDCDGEDDDPYEAVDVTLSAAAKSRSLQPLAVDDRQSANMLGSQRPDHSASAGEISSMARGTDNINMTETHQEGAHTLPPMFERERDDFRPRPRRKRPVMSPPDSGDRHEAERSRERRSPEPSEGLTRSPEGGPRRRGERNREHSSPESQSHRSPNHSRQRRSPDGTSKDDHERSRHRRSPNSRPSRSPDSETQEVRARPRPRPRHTPEKSSTMSPENEHPSDTVQRKDRHRHCPKNNSGHPNDGPSRHRGDGSPRERHGGDGPPRERHRSGGPPRERHAHDGPPRERHAHDGPPRERHAHDGPPRERHAHDGPPRERHAHDGPPRERHAHDGPPRERHAHDGPPRERHPSDGPPRERRADPPSKPCPEDCFSSRAENVSQSEGREAKERQKHSPETFSSTSSDSKSPVCPERKSRSQPERSKHTDSHHHDDQRQGRPEQDGQMLPSATYENAWQARSSPKPSPRIKHNKHKLKQASDEDENVPVFGENSGASSDIPSPRPEPPRRERGRQRQSPNKPGKGTHERLDQRSSSDSCGSELSEKPTQSKSSDTHIKQSHEEDRPAERDCDNPEMNTLEKSKGQRHAEKECLSKEKEDDAETPRPESVAPPQQPKHQGDAVSEADSSLQGVARGRSPETDGKTGSKDKSNRSHKPRDRSKGRSSDQEKPSVPPKPMYVPKERAPMQVLMGPPPPTAPPRKRGARIGSTEAEMFSQESGSKSRIFGRKQTR